MTTIQKKISQLDGPTRQKLNRLLSKTKTELYTMPGAAWLGSLMRSHNYVWDLECETAWCNGKTIGWNPNFFLELSPPARVTVLAHELDHTGYGHFTRCGNRCPDIWNIAADYVINNSLDNQGYTFDFGFKPYLDHKYDNMTTEQIYDQLIAEGMIPFDCPDPGNWNGQGDPGGSGLPGKQMTGDIRPLPSGDQGGTQDTVQAVQATIIKAQQAAIQANDPGSIPGEVKLYIDEFLFPKLDWRKLLRRYFTALSADDYSWRRPSRRYDEYLPSLIGDNGLEHVVYYLDVSGSISNGEIKRFNSEVRSIHKNLKPELLTLVTFDTEIHDVYEFTKDQPFNAIEITGRGGTCLDEVQADIERRKPTAAVIFSDMYVQKMQKDPGVPILWIVMDNAKASVPFGKMIHLDREDLT